MRRGIEMSAADAAAHQARHFGPKAAERLTAEPQMKPSALPKPVKMTRPEREYGLILEAMKRKGEIIEYKRWGIKLAWGTDPDTGRQMWYTPDFVVWPTGGTLTMVEVKGSKLFYTALVRFKGARAEWGVHFKFELHKLEKGVWTRIQ